MVALKLLFAWPYNRFAFGIERTSDRRSAFTPNLNLPSVLAFVTSPKRNPTVPKACQRGCLMFLRRFRKFTKRLNGLVKRMVGVAGFAIATVRH